MRSTLCKASGCKDLASFLLGIHPYSPGVLGRIAACLLIFLLIAGDAAVVQAVGWVGMLITRAQRMDWNAAVESTFGGEERCPMCHAAAALRDERGPGQPVPDQQTLGKLPSAPPGPLPCLPIGGGQGSELDPPAVAGAPDTFLAAPQPPPPQRA
jgi:hypothetical protein